MLSSVRSFLSIVLSLCVFPLTACAVGTTDAAPDTTGDAVTESPHGASSLHTTPSDTARPSFDRLARPGADPVAALAAGSPRLAPTALELTTSDGGAPVDERPLEP